MPARLKLALFLLIAAVALAVPATGGASTTWHAAVAPAAEEAPSEVTIQIIGFRVVPDSVAITTGTTVTWVNNEAIDYPVLGGSHELVADDGSWKSPPIAPGTRWSRRFDLPGVVKYHSASHSTAAGTIEVTGDPILDRPREQEIAITETNPDDPTTWNFAPNDVVIETGTTVIWRNNGKNVHTITADDKSFDSRDIAPGATWKYTFETPGAFAYHCTPHPWMKAGVRVVAPGSDAPPPPLPVAEEHQAASVPRTPAATPARVGRGPVRHEVAIAEPNPAKPTEWRFDPATLDVKVGDTVVWRNTGSVEHTVTGAAFDSGLLKPGATFERTFGASGVFGYNCTPHPWMKGVVRVTELDAEALPPLQVPAAAPTAPAAPPRRAAEAVRVGGGPVRHEALIVEGTMADPKSWTFDPPVLEARVGDRVVWRNTGTMQHTVTSESGAFDSGLLNPGAKFEYTFERPGVYAYRCTPHPWMKATVRVTDATGAEPPMLAAAPSDQSATPPTPEAEAPAQTTTVAGRIVESVYHFRPSMILPLSLALGALIIFATWLVAAAPWRRRPEKA